MRKLAVDGGNGCIEAFCRRPALSYHYTLDTKLKTQSAVSAERAMALFQTNPTKVFPFRVFGCDTLRTGAECTLDTRWN